MCSPAVCSLLLLCLATQAVAFTPRNFCWSFPANYTLLGLGRLNASHLLVMGTDECQHSCAGNFSAYVVPRDRFRPLDDRSSPSLSLVGLNAIGLTFNSTDATDQEELTKLANSRGVFMIQTSVDSGLAIFNVTRIHYYPVKRGVSARYMVNDPIYSPLYLHRKALFSMEEPTKLAYLNQTQEGEPSLVQEAFYNASETEKVKDTKFTVMYPIIFRNTTTVHGSIASPGDIEGGFIYKNVLYALDNTHHKMVMFRLGSKTAVSPTREVAYADFFICQGPSEVPRDETTTGKIRPSQFGLFLALGLVLLATAIIGFFILRISRGRKKRSKSTLPKRTSKIQSKPNIKAKDQNLAPAIYANAKHCKSQLGSKAAHTARSFLATTSGGTLRSKASRTNQTLPSSPNSISSSLIKVPTKSIHIPGKAHQPHSQLPKTGSLLNDSFSTAFK